MHITCEDDQLTIETTAPVTLTLWGKTLHVSGRKVCERKDFLVPVNGTATTEGAMTLNAVVFDLDGVITDTAHLHFLAGAPWRRLVSPSTKYLTNS